MKSHAGCIAHYEALSNHTESAVIPSWEAGEIREYRVARLEELIAEQAERSPSAIAVIDASGPLTYGQLENESNRLANVLRKRGLVPRSVAAVCLSRTADAIVAVLAILKAGAAYAPVESGWPSERIASVFRQLNVCVVVTDDS